MITRVPILSYHAILKSERAPVPPQWSRQHAVSLKAFRSQLDLLIRDGWRTVLPRDLEQSPPPSKSIIITFDDGHSSDMLAACELHTHKLKAVFFITWSFMGRQSFLNRKEVRNLADLGFEVGSHGLSHVRFAELTPDEMERQFALSKERLEQLTGKPVTTAAVPFGSYNNRVVAAAIAAGYRTIMTSDFACAMAGKVVLPRLGVLSRTTLKDFRVLLSGNAIGIARRRLINAICRRLNPESVESLPE